MSDVSIIFKRANKIYTNNDVIEGKVRLVLAKSTSIKDITVKLEGVSHSYVEVPRTELSSSAKLSKDRLRQEAKKPPKMLEDTHKILYRTQVVFPPPNVNSVSNAKEFTLAAGNYEYPFKFVIPMDNSCAKLDPDQSFGPSTTSHNARYQTNHNAGYHKSFQLPPSASFGHEGNLASIRYFVKSTVNRRGILTMNLRHENNFKFLPLEVNERSQESEREIFIRKAILLNSENSSPIPKKKGFFQRMMNPEVNSSSRRSSSNSSVPELFLEIRMKSPNISVNQIPKYRVFIVTKNDPSKYYTNAKNGNSGLSQEIYYKGLEGSLHITNIIIAHEAYNNHKHQNLSVESIKILNIKPGSFKLSNLKPTRNHAYYEYELDPRDYTWNIPKNLIPTFNICNIERYCTFVLRGIFSMSSFEWQYQASSSSVVELVCDVKLLSGIKAPNSRQEVRTSAPLARLPQDQVKPGETFPSTPNYNEPSTSINSQHSSQLNSFNDNSALPSYDEVVNQI